MKIPTYKCRLCPFESDSRSEFLEHVRSEKWCQNKLHQDTDQCKSCKKIYDTFVFVRCPRCSELNS